MVQNIKKYKTNQGQLVFFPIMAQKTHSVDIKVNFQMTSEDDIEGINWVPLPRKPEA
jgi:hypothetical protein